MAEATVRTWIRTTGGDRLEARIGGEEGGGGGSDLVIACRVFENPRGECTYCDRLAEYQTRNGADPDFELVCSLHAGQFLRTAGRLLESFE